MNRLFLLRQALRRKAPSPLGALARGLIAGAAGAAAQSLFFKLTEKWRPEPTRLPRGEGKPEGDEVSNLEAVASRVGEGLMKRGPLSDEQRSRAGRVLHYLYGAAWGGLYGLVRESFRIPPQLFGALVWMTSENLLLPLFRVAAWPNRYKLREHRYALQAHFAYGAATAGAYAVLRDFGPIPLRAVPGLIALQAWAFLLRSPPARLWRRRQPWTRRIIDGVLVQKAALA
ncbi:MAG: hypothetical protein E6J78_15955 [Deltaproteobacteria bacterium]|nr:MAG: hypothetical protein E6J78_15955 [Deltaproteobacteria bacterium]